MLSITHPVPYEVLQRKNDNTQLVEVLGECPKEVARVRIDVVPLEAMPNQGEKAGPYYLKPTAEGKLAGLIPVKGGWYTLKATIVTPDGTDGAVAMVEPWGVGEVLVVWGHSVAAGDESGWIGAKDPRVVAPNNLPENASPSDAKFEFGPLGDNAPLGPFLKAPAQWGKLGDMLTQRYKVPVAVYGTAFGGSSLQQAYNSIVGIPFEHPFVKYELGMPYRPLQTAMSEYAVTTGVRAVIVQHGINDIGRSEEDFYTHYKRVIDHTRTLFNMPSLPFMLVLDAVPKLEEAEPNRKAIKRLWQLPNVYQAFDFQSVLDTTVGREDRVHLKTAEDYSLYASLINESLTDDFFKTSKAVAPKTTSQPALTQSGEVLPTPKETVLDTLRSEFRSAGESIQAGLVSMPGDTRMLWLGIVAASLLVFGIVIFKNSK